MNDAQQDFGAPILQIRFFLALIRCVNAPLALGFVQCAGAGCIAKKRGGRSAIRHSYVRKTWWAVGLQRVVQGEAQVGRDEKRVQRRDLQR